MKKQTTAMPQSSTLRVQRLRERIINASQEICIERARYLTRSMAENWSKHPLTRMSLALENILKNISVIIRNDEIVVGCRTSKLKGAPLFPENKSGWIEGDTDNFDNRAIQKALISADEKRELKEEVLPFWKGRTVEDYFGELLSPDVAEDMDKFIFTMMLEITYGIGHFTMDYRRILSLGLAGIIEQARQKYDLLNAEDRNDGKGLFYDAMIRSLNASIDFARRYSRLAYSMASEAERKENLNRAVELREIGRICGKVPEQPAETFHEAIQSMYFIHLISQIESGGNSISLGRIDQNLYPYYKQDLKADRITRDRAKELAALTFLKTNEIWNVLEEAYIPGGEGTEGKTTQNVIVGGIGTNGEDATNELSYVVLEAYAEIRTVQPNFGVRLSAKSPDDFFLRAVEYARDGVLTHFFQ